MLFNTRWTSKMRVIINYLPVGARVYVLGRVERQKSGLCFVKGGETFIISTKREDELLSGKSFHYKLYLSAGIALLLISLVCFVKFIGSRLAA